MPVDRAKYPPDWKHVSRAVRDRSGGQCECEGHCGLHRTNPGPRRCVERNGEKATWARGKVVLTVAHLNADGGPCRCEPLCGNPEHLKAMCQRCHLRYDYPMHVRNARASGTRTALFGALSRRSRRITMSQEQRLPEPTYWRPSWRYRLLSRAQRIVAWLVGRTPVGGSRLVDLYMRLDDARARCP